MPKAIVTTNTNPDGSYKFPGLQRGSGAPEHKPSEGGQYYLDQTNGIIYASIGNNDSSDWHPITPDVYNFYIASPKAGTSGTYTDTALRQMIYRSGIITKISACFGAVRTGSPTGANEINVVNNGTQVLGSDSSDDTYDNLTATTTADVITSFASGTSVTAGNYLGIHIEELRASGSGEQSDLLIQVEVGG